MNTNVFKFSASIKANVYGSRGINKTKQTIPNFAVNIFEQDEYKTETVEQIPSERDQICNHENDVRNPENNVRNPDYDSNLCVRLPAQQQSDMNENLSLDPNKPLPLVESKSDSTSGGYDKSPPNRPVKPVQSSFLLNKCTQEPEEPVLWSPGQAQNLPCTPEHKQDGAKQVLSVQNQTQQQTCTPQNQSMDPRKPVLEDGNKFYSTEGGNNKSPPNRPVQPVHISILPNCTQEPEKPVLQQPGHCTHGQQTPRLTTSNQSMYTSQNLFPAAHTTSVQVYTEEPPLIRPVEPVLSPIPLSNCTQGGQRSCSREPVPGCQTSPRNNCTLPKETSYETQYGSPAQQIPTAEVVKNWRVHSTTQHYCTQEKIRTSSNLCNQTGLYTNRCVHKNLFQT